MNRVDLYAALSYVAGGGLAATAVAFGTLMPRYAQQIVAISGIVIGVAGLLARLIKNPTTPPAPCPPTPPTPTPPVQ